MLQGFRSTQGGRAGAELPAPYRTDCTTRRWDGASRAVHYG